MSDDADRIYQLAIKQAGTDANLANAQHDINAIANAQRQDVIELKAADDCIDEKVETLKTDVKIYKALVGLIGAVVIGIAYCVSWVIEHIEILKGLYK